MAILPPFVFTSICREIAFKVPFATAHANSCSLPRVITIAVLKRLRLPLDMFAGRIL